MKIHICEAEGTKLRTERDAVDLIASSQGADWILVPVERLDPDFFRLRTRVAGEFIQKLVTYGRRLAVIGDISTYTEESTALRDFVYEANRGRDVWFLSSRADFDSRVAGL